MSAEAAIAALIAEFYDVVSGPAGPRDLAREKALFHPAARLMRSGVGPDGRPWLEVMTPEGWVEDTAAFFAAHDFYERETAGQIEVFGQIAWARSVYEARERPDAPAPVKRGINTIQLYWDGTRWWIVNVLWADERPDLPIPAAWA